MKIAADIIWSEGQSHLNQSLEFSNGLVTGISDADDADVTLSNHAILPGFANAHSHSFQRVIRGRTEWSHRGQSDDFWSWRDAMYHAANRLSPKIFEAIAEWTFVEMIKAGVTVVGEFHYVHHQPNGTPYDNVAELSERVIAAAQRLGLRLTHMPVAYARGGFRRPLVKEQSRFTFDEPHGYLQLVDQLRTRYQHDSIISIGMAPHSVRAVDQAWLTECAQATKSWQTPTHIHACEQERELEECAEEYGKSPIELLADLHLLTERTTLVHGTHLTETDLDLIGASNALVCGCPTTEANLGDGFLPSVALLERKVRICLGSDSNAQIDLCQEARFVEMQQRLQLRQRNVLARFTNLPGAIERTADVIWPMLTQHGYQSLGWDGGELAKGEVADFIVVDLSHPSLLGVSPADLRDTLILSGQNEAIRAAYVHGKQVLKDGKCEEEDRIRNAYLNAISTLKN